MKLTLEKINYLIRDEDKAIREYRRLKLFKLSRSETSHKRFLIKLRRRLFKKGKYDKRNKEFHN